MLVEECLELREVGFDLREINARVRIPLIIFVPADSLLQVPHLLGHLAVDFDQASVQGVSIQAPCTSRRCSSVAWRSVRCSADL